MPQSKPTPEITSRLVAAIQQVNCSEAEAALSAGVGERTLRRWKAFAEKAEEVLPEGWEGELSADDLRDAAAALSIKVPARISRARLIAVLKLEADPFLDMLRRVRRAVVEGEFVLAQRIREIAMGGKFEPRPGRPPEFVPERRTKVKRVRDPSRPGLLMVVEETETVVGPRESAIRFILSRRYAERWRPPRSAEVMEKGSPQEYAEKVGQFLKQAIGVSIGREPEDQGTGEGEED